MSKTWVAKNTDALNVIAAELMQLINPGTRIAFYGEMGAGKTTFIKAICAHLGITESTSSPTFSIVNTYHGDVTIYHFDLFRLNKIEELQEIGFGSYLEDDAYVFIEWPELIESVLDEANFSRVKLSTLSDVEREITLV